MNVIEYVLIVKIYYAHLVVGMVVLDVENKIIIKSLSSPFFE
jgi:hypothetical protein